MQASNYYLTADRIGAKSGGGIVTFQERESLKILGDVTTIRPWEDGVDPFEQDQQMLGQIFNKRLPKIAHFYAGCFGKTLTWLKSKGVVTTATAAAHDVEASRREHEKLGIPYPYPHITEPDLWKRYVQGYLEADVLICPSRHSAKVMQGFGFNGRIEIIPHGVDLPKCKRCNGEKGYYEYDDPDTGEKNYFIDCPEEGCWTHDGSTGVAPIAPLPERFTVGYLGAIGPDKGLRYLIEAWGKLAYKDATLVIAGRDSTHPFVQQMINQWGGNANFNLLGWVEDVSTFYNSLSLYVQPSVTEGFGIEVLEAMAYGRPVVCSTGAGAADVLLNAFSIAGMKCMPADSDDLAGMIAYCRSEDLREAGCRFRQASEHFTWDKVRQRYVNLWKELLK